MSCGEENTECPLCMEPLEMDDINFFPCTCGYQICRFCWHRIRTDENGLCPACRKQYPEDPAEFKPLTEDELQRIKKERRQKDLQRKQKAAENRKHLANVRVVQRNLVFVVGLSQRLADPEVLKKHEYFGKFGKIHKVVINHSTSYAGAQGPSASAYVTYHKPEDALRAIQAVNNIYVDGRTLKASLGTTKYCSHFLRGAQCPKPDCMYLHELGEEAASFTKEEMQQGKHQEYEQKLYEGFMNSQNLSNHQTLPPPSSSSLPTVPSTTTNSTTTATNSSNNTASSKAQRKKTSSPPTIQPSGGTNSSHPPPNTNKEAWPSLSSSGGSNNSGGRPERLTNGNKAPHPPSQSPTSQSSTSSLSSGSSTSSTSSTSSSSSAHKQDVQNAQNRAPGHHRSNNHTNIEPHNSHNHSNSKKVTQGNNSRNAVSPLSAQSPPPHLSLQASPPLHQVSPPPSQVPQVPGVVPPLTQSPIGTSRRSPFDTSDSLSLFSNSGFPTMRNPNKPAVATTTTTAAALPEGISAIEIPDTIPVSSTTDWSAAFGFSSSSHNTVEPHDDDLGFDPWDESSKALADLIEKESYPQYPYMSEHSRLSGLMNNGPNNDQYAKNLPPGFAPNHIGAYTNQIPRPGASKMMGLQFAPMANHNSQNTYHDMLSDISLSSMSGDNHTTHHNTQNANVNVQDWQDGLRALLPNINISFGAPTAPITPPNHQHPPQPHPQQQQQQHHHHPQQQQQQQQMRPHSHKDWSNSSNSPSTDLPLDPAIVISGNITHSTSLSDDTPPHWMASLHHLTEDNTNHRLPFVHQFPFRGPTWGGPQAHHPPPGFHQTHLSSPTRVAETHRLAEGLQ